MAENINKSKLSYAGFDHYFSFTIVVTESFLCPTCEGCAYKGQDESATQQQIFWDAHASDRQQDESGQCHPSKVHPIYISFYTILL